ncbi:transposase [Escherichia coli]
MHPQNHLAGYSGVLQADAYGGYRALYESANRTEAACMAHARSKNPRCACKSAHLHHHGSPAAYR